MSQPRSTTGTLAISTLTTAPDALSIRHTPHATCHRHRHPSPCTTHSPIPHRPCTPSRFPFSRIKARRSVILFVARAYQHHPSRQSVPRGCGCRLRALSRACTPSQLLTLRHPVSLFFRSFMCQQNKQLLSFGERHSTIHPTRPYALKPDLTLSMPVRTSGPERRATDLWDRERLLVRTTTEALSSTPVTPLYIHAP